MSLKGAYVHGRVDHQQVGFLEVSDSWGHPEWIDTLTEAKQDLITLLKIDY